jgi:hypothetical protein
MDAEARGQTDNKQNGAEEGEGQQEGRIDTEQRGEPYP